MKPSWQVMKLTLACGRRPLHSYKSLEPLIRVANSRGHAAVALPESPHCVAILAVPLAPQHGKVADLVAAFAEIPRFGDELHLAEHWVLVNDVEERAQLVDFVQLAGQRAGQIEAEAIDVHLDDPVAQAVHDELQHARVAHVAACFRSR